MALQIRYINSDVESIELKDLCLNPDSAFTSQQGIIKNDSTTSLSRLKLDTGEVVVKRYNTKNFWHLIRRNFQTSRAENCYAMARVFESKGISIPEPLGVIEHCLGPFSGKSWYISRYVDNVMLLDYLSQDLWRTNFLQILPGVLKIFRVLADNQLSHGDMKATNLLVKDDDLWVIDLDGAKFHNSIGSHRSALKKDKARFLKNWNGNPELREKFQSEISKIC